MNATKCPARAVLLAYHTGELAEASANEVIVHLSQCPHCQGAVNAFGDAEDSLIVRLRRPPVQELYTDEPECRELIERAKAIVEATFSNVAPEAGTSVGKKDVPPSELFGNSPSSPTAVPAQLREYRILERLGAGGMGTVYKALHTKLDKLVALKVLPAAAMQDAELVARFEREMKAVGKLEHPNIVRAMDAGCHEGLHFLVMEFVDGMDLGGIVKGCGQLRIADACEVIRQAALGLRHADEHALVHRDIKPSNLVLSREGEVKILDLGLALLHSERMPGEEPTDRGRAMGTLDYMAPEQARDSHTVDIRADLYSLGCTLYKLLTGQAPFSGLQYQSSFDKMMAHMSQPFPLIRQQRPDVPQKLAAVLQRMVAKDRDARYAKPSQVIDELKPFCPGCDLAGLLAHAEKLPSPSGLGLSHF